MYTYIYIYICTSHETEQAFKRIKDLEIDIVAPGHGPLLKQHKAE